MRIHIIGNIASGKSFLAKKLSENTGLTVFSIDDFRQTINNLAGFEGEKLVWMTFENIVMAHPDCITESTGVSYHWPALITMCPGIIIKVITPWKQCLKNHKHRIKNENWQAPPLPYKFDLKESLQRNEYLLTKIRADFEFFSGEEEKFYDIFKNIEVFSK